MQDLWQEISAHSYVYSKLLSFGICCLHCLECGLYEASDLLLGDHLCEKSTTIKWMDVSPSHNRKRRLRNDFVAEYEKCGEYSDGNPIYHERTKPILPNHRVYDPANGKTTTTTCFSCSFPSATKQTSSKRGRLPRVLSNGTWGRMTN